MPQRPFTQRPTSFLFPIAMKLISSSLFLLKSMALAATLLGALAFGGPARAADRVIVLDSGEALLTLIDPVTRKVVGTEPTGKEPRTI